MLCVFAVCRSNVKREPCVVLSRITLFVTLLSNEFERKRTEHSGLEMTSYSQTHKCDRIRESKAFGILLHIQ